VAEGRKEDVILPDRNTERTNERKCGDGEGGDLFFRDVDYFVTALNGHIAIVIVITGVFPLVAVLNLKHLGGR
jgi:hypothetical protein